MVQLITAQTGQPFSQEPAISLKYLFGGISIIAKSDLQDSNTTGWDGKIHAVKLTGLTPNLPFNGVGIKYHSGSGNVRVKVYAADGAGGAPGTLLGESDTTAISTDADSVQYILLLSASAIPASGNVWVAFETDNATLSIWYGSSDTNADTVSHAYGLGPSPFGIATTGQNGFYSELVNQPQTTPLGQYAGKGSSSALPSVTTVYVDTKFGTSPAHNKIIIENMPRLTTYQTLGGQRIRTRDIKRIQVWCDTKAARNNKWLIEEEIKRIIMSNMLGLKTVGIDQITIERGFADIETQDGTGDADQVGRGGYLARSSCLVAMIYDEIVV